ncbi:hypothetical protein [Chitinimonas sp.]|uniref:hypothetical protein n=1 Tax=Chitinimonas sp. TaxID=1934313 RepID=UPI002F934D3B
MTQNQLPDFYESFTAICRFLSAETVSGDFYEKHAHALMMAGAFIGTLASQHPVLKTAIIVGLQQPVREAAVRIRQVIPGLGLTNDEVRWLDDQTTAILRVLVPVVRDPDLPEWFAECKWAIEGAFH